MPYTEKREKTKKVIMKTFADLYAENDIEKVSIKKLCDKANINRSTFYSYYLDIYDLREKFEEDLIDYVGGNLQGLYEKVSLDHLDDVYIAITDLIHNNSNALMLFLSKGDEEFRKKLVKRIMDVVKSFGGDLDEEDVKLLDYCFHYHFSAVSAVLKKWEDEKDQVEFEVIFGYIFNIAKSGVLGILKERVLEKD